MTIPNIALQDLENRKFVYNSNGEESVNVVAETTFSPIPSGLLEVQSIFSQALAVPLAIETVVQSYLVGASGFYLYAIELSGQNRATFNLYFNGVLSGVKRLTLTKYQETFSFQGNFALKLNHNDLIEIKVVNQGEGIADFDSRILGVG